MRFRSSPFFIFSLTILLSACSHGMGVSSPVGGSSQPQGVTRDAVGWTSFDIGRFAYAIVLGHDGFMYAVTDGTSITKIDPITYQITRIALNGSRAYALTPNPDGNIYTVELLNDDSASLVRIAPDGGVTEIPIPGTEQVQSMVSGSDQRIWMLRHNDNGYYLAATTTDGQYVQFPSAVSAYELARGPDKNIWGLDGQGYVRFSILDGSPTEFPSTDRGLAEGGDSQFWGPSSATKAISSFNPMTQQTATFPIRPRVNSGVFITKNLRFAAYKYLYSFNITKGKIVDRIPEPWPLSAEGGVSYEGPNHQLWVMSLDPGNVIFVYQF